MPLPSLPVLRHARLPALVSALCLACAMPRLAATELVVSPGTSESGEAAKEKAQRLTAAQVAEIEAAFARVDRVMLCSGLPWEGAADPEKLDTPLIDIRGAEKVRELVRAMDLSGGSFDEPCMCIGSHRLVLMRGDSYRFELSYHHHSRLRGDYGIPYWGDLQLSEKGAQSVLQWFAANGFGRLQENAAKEKDFVAARKAAHAKLAAFLPEKVRDWLPAYDHNSGQWMWQKDERASALLGCFSNEQEAVLTLWQMVGFNTRNSQTGSRIYQGEPAGFLFNVLDRAKPETLLAVEQALPSDDKDARLGAFMHAYHCLTTRDQSGSFATAVRIVKAQLGHGLDAFNERDRYYLVCGLLRPESKPVPDILAKELDRALARREAGVSPEASLAASGDPEDTLLLRLLAMALESKDAALLDALDRAEALPTLSAYQRRMCGLMRRLAAPVPSVGPEDLLIKEVGSVDMSLLAWQAYRAGHPEEPSLRMLASALRSPSYRVKDAAAQCLRASGIDFEESPAERSRSRGREKDEDPGATLLRLEKAAKAAITAKERKTAYQNLGDLLVSRGEYEQALIAFRKAGDYASVRANLAGIALGRPNEGRFLSHILTRSNEAADKFIARGMAELAVGRFEESASHFRTASHMADWPVMLEVATAAKLLDELAALQAVGTNVASTGKPGIQVVDGDEDVLAGFVAGTVTKEAFLREWRHRGEPSRDAFAWWVIAMKSRIAKDKAGEAEALRAGMAMGAYDSVWHVLMVCRARQLADE